MNIHVGDVRKIPMPVLDPRQKAQLEELANRAVAEKLVADRGDLSTLDEVEIAIDHQVRTLYGIPTKAQLWVVR